MSGAYYNEIDPFCANYLRNLIRAGLIADGEVDSRSIEDVAPDDLKGFTQCHFFAGIGVWSYALRRAGWSDDREVWTGSCPCQPFSAAGKGKGFVDERHLWPAFFHLIRVRRPQRVFGEQVASKDGLAWFELVSTDLEGENYAVGVQDTCAAGVGSPNIRQRLYFVGAEGLELPESFGRIERWTESSRRRAIARCGAVGLADAEGFSGGSGLCSDDEAGGWRSILGDGRAVHDLDDALSERLEGYARYGYGAARWPQSPRSTSEAGGNGGMGDSCSPGTGSKSGDGAGAQRAVVGRDGSASRSFGPARFAGAPDGVADEQRQRSEVAILDARGGGSAGGERQASEPGVCGAHSGLAIPDDAERRANLAGRNDAGGNDAGRTQDSGDARPSGGSGGLGYDGRPRPTNGFWRAVDWLFCRDGKWRPVEPGTFPLAHGASARVGRLRSYGNAINAENARGFIEDFQEVEREWSLRSHIGVEGHDRLLSALAEATEVRGIRR